MQAKFCKSFYNFILYKNILLIFYFVYIIMYAKITIKEIKI